MPDPIIVYPNAQNTKDFSAVPNDALIPGIDPSQSGFDAGLFFPKSSLPFGGEGAVKHGNRRTLVTPTGQPGITIPYDSTGDFASILTINYTPRSALSRVYIRAMMRVTGDDGSQFSFLMARRKIAGENYHAIESLSGKQASLIGTNDSWDWYEYVAPIDNSFRLGFNSIPTLYEGIFVPAGNGLAEQTINICAALGDIAVTRQGPPIRVAWSAHDSNAVFTGDNFLAANGASVGDGSSIFYTIPEFPATLPLRANRKIGYLGIWIPDPWPFPNHILLQSRVFHDPELAGGNISEDRAFPLEVEGVAGNYYPTLRGQLADAYEMVDLAIRFNRELERMNTTQALEIKSGNVYVNRANEDLISHLQVEAGVSFVEVFELLENGNFSYSSTQQPDAA